MATNKKIAKAATSVSNIIKICDTQIQALQYLESAIIAVARASIEHLIMTKHAAAETLVRRMPSKKPKRKSKSKPRVK